jgi:hypothetical protein
MRKFTKKKELVQPIIIQFAKKNISLETLSSQKNSIKRMFIRQELIDSKYNKRTNTNNIATTIFNYPFGGMPIML